QRVCDPDERTHERSVVHVCYGTTQVQAMNGRGKRTAHAGAGRAVSCNVPTKPDIIDRCDNVDPVAEHQDAVRVIESVTELGYIEVAAAATGGVAYDSGFAERVDGDRNRISGDDVTVGRAELAQVVAYDLHGRARVRARADDRVTVANGALL